MSVHPFGRVLLRRAERIGERRAETIAQRLCDEIGVILPDIKILRERGRVRLTGRALRRRWITDAALRWLGRLLR
ncbi:hypothetical protein [Blastomonas sp.]|uniref:hypothetical protein n=1 Tax=Blastomonas sp. TaxID=1909299 RepID=UPI00391BA086